MSENIIITSFPYYSLPQFPDLCSYHFNSKLFLRDMFACNSITKINHYEYPKFQDFSYDIGCNGKFLKNLFKEFKKKKEVYILFRTTQINLNSKIKETFVIGYFKVSAIYKIKTELFKNSEFFAFESKETVLVDKGNAIIWPLDAKRGAPNSNNKKNQDKILSLFQYFKSLEKTPKNKYLEYQSETIQLLNNLQDQNYRTSLSKACIMCSQQNCILKKKFLRINHKYKFENYLDYLYHPKVFLTNIISKLKDQGKIEEI